MLKDWGKALLGKGALPQPPPVRTSKGGEAARYESVLTDGLANNSPTPLEPPGYGCKAVLRQLQGSREIIAPVVLVAGGITIKENPCSS